MCRKRGDIRRASKRIRKGYERTSLHIQKISQTITQIRYIIGKIRPY